MNVVFNMLCTLVDSVLNITVNLGYDYNLLGLSRGSEIDERENHRT